MSGIGPGDGGFLRWVFGIDTVTGALITTLNNPDPTASDLFGVGVAVAGNIAVIGASADDPGGVGNAGLTHRERESPAELAERSSSLGGPIIEGGLGRGAGVPGVMSD